MTAGSSTTTPIPNSTENTIAPEVAPGSGRRSPLLDRPGAVAGDGRDAPVAAHYGDPLREQRAARRGAAVVDRSHRDVLRISGPDRLSWLHSITSQHLSALGPLRGTEALVLSPHGHVEHHLVLADDGTSTWVDVEPGTGAALLAYLESMRFMLRVEPVDASATTAVLSALGPDAPGVVAAALTASGSAAPALGEPAAAEPTGAPVTGPYPVGRGEPDVLVRRMSYGVDLLVPRERIADVATRLQAAGAGLAGQAAFEALRIADRRPRFGSETDHRTIPQEVGWLASAVHLDKGCYRGQETVARVHNLGRPPRRLVLLHLDGAVAAAHAPVTAGGREVGFVGSAEVHEELGPVALAVVKRSVPADSALVVTDPDGAAIAAAIDPDDAAQPPAPQRPAGRLRA